MAGTPPNARGQSPANSSADATGGSALEGGAARKGDAEADRVRVFNVRIDSDFTAGRDVQRQIREAVEELGYGANDVFAINLALEESLINAIKHGNKFDPTKKVTISARVDPGSVEIVIEDEGPGFVRREVPDPTLDENLEKTSGRGILLIESYMTEVGWTNGGRRLRMVKQRQDEMAARA